MKKLKTNLEGLLAQARKSPMGQSRSWIVIKKPRASLSIYFRIGRLYSSDRPSSILTISSADAVPQGKGLFTEALSIIEEFASTNSLSIYVENVINPRFADFWRKKGYAEIDVGGIPCFEGKGIK